MKRILSIIIVLALMLFFTACLNDFNDSVVSLAFQPSSFKEVYDVDEELNLDSIVLSFKYKSGQVVNLPCTLDMVKGFDTTTTGDKTLYIEHKDAKSTAVDYQVVNKGNETVSINTSCRLSFTSESLSNAASYAFQINNGDIAKIKGIFFTIKSISDLGVNIAENNLEITNLPSGWVADKRRVDKNTLKILITNRSGMDIDSALSFATINIIEQNKVQITVSKITVSDGEKDYNLPNIK